MDHLSLLTAGACGIALHGGDRFRVAMDNTEAALQCPHAS
jgi:hypothetical protein